MSEKDELIKYLVSKKFPVNYFHREKRLVRQGQIKAEMWPGIEENIKTYCDELSKKTLEEIAALSRAEANKKIDQHKKQQEEFELRRQKKLFFNQPAAKADFDYWSKMPSWTIDEAVALLLEKDPRVVSWDNICPHATPTYKEPELFAKEYQNLRGLLIRKYGTNQYIKIIPGDLIKWANDVGIKVPIELKKMVLQYQDANTDWQNLCKSKCREIEGLKKTKKNPSASTIELETKNKMIIAMAKKKYRFDMNVPKNSATKNIYNDIAECGLSVSEDTILRHLREAAGLLPPNVE